MEGLVRPWFGDDFEKYDEILETLDIIEELMVAEMERDNQKKRGGKDEEWFFYIFS